jgi:hypothetical protein
MLFTPEVLVVIHLISIQFMEHRPDLAEHIRTYSDRPRDALTQARRHKPEQREDWFSVNVQMVTGAFAGIGISSGR